MSRDTQYCTCMLMYLFFITFVVNFYLLCVHFRLCLQTIADKTRQTEGLLTQIHDLRHQLNEMSESNTSKQKSVVQDISKLQQQQRELRGEIERKAEELAAVTKKKQDAEKQLSSLKKAHATEMQHVKADLTRKVNKLNREVAIRV